MGSGGVEPAHQKRNIINITSYNYPNDQYVCTLCKNVPELKEVYDNGIIELVCKEHGLITLTVQQYFEKMTESEFIYYNFKCANCGKIQKNCLKIGLFKFCYVCQKIYCQDCCEKTIAHEESHKTRCIFVNEMNNRCLDHFDEGVYTSFCHDDKENICETYVKKKHRGHNCKIFFDIETNAKVIEERNEILRNMIKFNELILNTHAKHPHNYFHIINVKKLAESIELENKRDPKELENLFKELEMNIKLKNKAIKEFKEKYKNEINGKEERLILRKKGLDDLSLRTLSNIKFLNLKEMDLSYNNIRNIDYLQYMFSKFLQYLSLNDNKIEDIKVLESMDFSNLKELNLQNNNIKKVEPLLETKMPVLELLRIEGNNDLNPVMHEMKQLIKKYTKKIVFVVQTYQDFNKKYDVSISKTNKKLDLNGNSKGSEILKDLYLLLPENNEVEELRLVECSLENISYISRIFLPNVQKIDLSFNKIIHIEPLCDLKSKKLRTLYLNDNNISDISPLKRIKFYGDKPKITIENNNIIQNNEVKNIIKELESKNIKVKIE